MTDKYKIDSHKLIYHIPRVNDWLDGKTIYPLYMEISPSGACNHRCTFCGLDFMEYQSRYNLISPVTFALSLLHTRPGNQHVILVAKIGLTRISG